MHQKQNVQLKQKEKTMKKRMNSGWGKGIALLMAAVMTVTSIGGCSSGKEEPKNTTAASSAA